MTVAGRVAPPLCLAVAVCLAAAVCAGGAVGCDATSGFVVEGDATFTAAADTGTSLGDTTGTTVEGCSVADPGGCAAAGLCCDAGERCVPGVDGANRCVAAGALSLGDDCLGRPDACGVASLCVSHDAGSGATCRALCRTALDCGGAECAVVLELAGETIRACP